MHGSNNETAEPTIKRENPFLNDKVEVGTRIRALRNKKELTQQALADLVGKSRPAIAQWEKGEASPPLSDINALAFYLNTTPQFLAFGISSSTEDSYKVPVMDYAPYPRTDIVGEMSLDMEFFKSLHLPTSAVLRAYKLPRNEMMDGMKKGDVIIVDESDKTLVGVGEPILIFHKVPAVAYISAVPGKNDIFAVRVGGQTFQMNATELPMIGSVVATLKSMP